MAATTAPQCALCHFWCQRSPMPAFYANSCFWVLVVIALVVGYAALKCVVSLCCVRRRELREKVQIIVTDPVPEASDGGGGGTSLSTARWIASEARAHAQRFVVSSVDALRNIAYGDATTTTLRSPTDLPLYSGALTRRVASGVFDGDTNFNR